MKHIIHKMYYDYEKEENWLNEMSANGMTLIKYTWCRYVFIETPKNEYTYRLELLEHMPSHPKSIAYIEFLKETGIEYITSYMRWIYLRKKSCEGAFDIYSDIESKVIHYRRINVIFNTVMSLEFMIGFINVIMGFVILCTQAKTGNSSISNFFSGGMCLILGLLFLKLGSQNRKKVKKLTLENSINN